MVRAEALIMAMHAILAVIGMRFADRTESLREECFSVMEPYLLAAGLPGDRIIDHCNSRFVEYGQLMIEKVKGVDSLADFELGSRIAAHVTGCRPEQVAITRPITGGRSIMPSPWELCRRSTEMYCAQAFFAEFGTRSGGQFGAIKQSGAAACVNRTATPGPTGA
ncbi:MAG: hypothetical protein L0191_04155 [Acidobacteria bacterium]|nr:hypothetical protein [Acidobacteriota bacterium]